MRLSDSTTLFRVVLIFAAIYLIILKFNPFVIILLIVVSFLLDGIDGYIALWEESIHKLGFSDYIKSAMGNAKINSYVLKLKKSLAARQTHGGRLDVAADRVTEYALWIIFTVLGLVPLFILFLVVIRHSFADAFMGSKGTSSHMKSRFARVFHTSKTARASSIVLKLVTFSFLSWMYVTGNVTGTPLLAGYVLIAILTIQIMVRGAAQIYENVAY